jgi:S1-C subfamily serine protease
MKNYDDLEIVEDEELQKEVNKISKRMKKKKVFSNFSIYFLVLLSCALSALAIRKSFEPRINYHGNVTMVTPTPQKTYFKVPDEMLKSVIKIQILDNGNFGSGVIIGKNFILTSAHLITEVIDGPPVVMIKRKSGKDEIRGDIWTEVYVSRIDSGSDLALLYSPADLKFKPATVATEDEVEIGEELIIIGGPWGGSITTSKRGLLSDKETRHRSTPRFMWQTDAGTFPGSSGGPVFSVKTGKIIGIVSSIPAHPNFGPSQNVTYFVPWDKISDFVGPQPEPE